MVKLSRALLEDMKEVMEEIVLTELLQLHNRENLISFVNTLDELLEELDGR